MRIHDSRRDFLKLAGLSASLPLLSSRLALAQAPPARRDVLVAIFQRGGLDGLNAVVPYGDPDYYRQRGTLAIPAQGEDSVIRLDAGFGLHPALAALGPSYEAGELALVHAAGAPTASRSHFSCQDLIERAVFDGTGSGSGWLNRHLQSRGAASAFQGVGMGTAVPRSMSGPASVLGIASFDDFALTTTSLRAAEITATLDLLHAGSAGVDAVAHTAFVAIEQLRAADPAQYPADNGAVYPATAFGRQMRQVAQLIKADIGLEVASVDVGGWDHHDDELRRLAPLLEDFAATLAAFRTDLGAAMQGVCVVSMSEFGRRVRPNASGGTDHGAGNCLFVLGGGVVGGRVYADWPGLADTALDQGDLAITTDYRAVLGELLRKRRGETAVGQVFPGYADTYELGMFRPT